MTFPQQGIDLAERLTRGSQHLYPPHPAVDRMRGQLGAVCITSNLLSASTLWALRIEESHGAPAEIPWVGWPTYFRAVVRGCRLTGDPRSDRTGLRGSAHVTVDEIAAAAGVGKQTIYRWWPSRGDFVLDALLEGTLRMTPFPDTADARGLPGTPAIRRPTLQVPGRSRDLRRGGQRAVRRRGAVGVRGPLLAATTRLVVRSAPSSHER